jgi:hypothetical protein
MVAWIALVVSALALTWQIVVAVRDRPHIGVATRGDVTIHVGSDRPVEYRWHVTVINYGRHPQTIEDIGLIGKDPGFSTQFSQLRSSGVQIDGPSLPATIAPYSFHDWLVPHETLCSRFPQNGQEFRSYVVRFTTLHRPERLNAILQRRRERGRRVSVIREYEGGYRRMPSA